MHLPAPAAVGVLTVAVIASACSNPLPGTMLGTYQVVAQSQTNVCDLAASNPWTFDVELSQDGTTLYWSWMDGSAPLSGPITTEAVTLLATEQVNVDGTADGGLGPCNLERDDTLTLTLGTGSPVMATCAISEKSRASALPLRSFSKPSWCPPPSPRRPGGRASRAGRCSPRSPCSDTSSPCCNARLPGLV